MLALDESGYQATVHDLFKELLKQVRLPKASITVLGEGGVMGNLLWERSTHNLHYVVPIRVNHAVAVQVYAAAILVMHRNWVE